MESKAYLRKIYRIFPWNQRHISVKTTETFYGINGIFPQNLRHCSMESTKLRWNQRQKSTAFHKLPQFFVVDLFAINCHGNLKNTVRTLLGFLSQISKVFHGKSREGNCPGVFSFKKVLVLYFVHQFLSK